MGTWGSGNFQDDAALDAYAELVADLVGRIDAAFGAEPLQIEDVWGEMALVEVLATLHEHCRPARVPRPLVAKWSERVLAAYDAQIDALGAKEPFRSERRAVIEKTFQRLLAAPPGARNEGDRS